MRISDWSSDVCSSDLLLDAFRSAAGGHDDVTGRRWACRLDQRIAIRHVLAQYRRGPAEAGQDSGCKKHAFDDRLHGTPPTQLFFPGYRPKVAVETRTIVPLVQGIAPRRDRVSLSKIGRAAGRERVWHDG